jgi:hypothetical protein
MRAGGRIAAFGTQPGRNDPLVDLYEQDKRKTKDPE